MRCVSGYSSVHEVSNMSDTSGLNELKCNDDGNDGHCFTQLSRSSSLDGLLDCSDGDIFDDIWSPAAKKNKPVSSRVCIYKYVPFKQKA